MLNLTTTELKTLSKAVKSRFSFLNISNLLNPIIKDESFKESLKRIIGKKGTETVKNNVANEFVADLLGYENFNTVLHVAEKHESLSKSEIVSKLNNLVNSFEYSDESYLQNHTIECLHENLDNFKIDGESYIAELLEELDIILTCESNIMKNKAFESINSLFNSKINTIEIQSCNDDNPDYYEVRFIMELLNGDKLTIDVDLTTENGEISRINTERSLINGVSLDDCDHNDFIFDFLVVFADGVFQTNVIPNKNKTIIDDEKMKKISLFLSQI
jgi:hypothetical protein